MTMAIRDFLLEAGQVQNGDSAPMHVHQFLLVQVGDAPADGPVFPGFHPDIV